MDLQRLTAANLEASEARAAETEALDRMAELAAEAAALRARVEEYERVLVSGQRGVVGGLVAEVSRLQVRGT